MDKSLVLTLLSTSVATAASVREISASESGRITGKPDTCSDGIRPENHPALIVVKPPTKNPIKLIHGKTKKQYEFQDS